MRIEAGSAFGDVFENGHDKNGGSVGEAALYEWRCSYVMVYFSSIIRFFKAGNIFKEPTLFILEFRLSDYIVHLSIYI